MAIRPVIEERYQLGALLGRGGMGEVRAATDTRLGREVAVKLLRVDLAEQESLRGRFEREARAAARVTHPNVVAIYDTGEQDGVPFIVMERLPGNSLADELAIGPLGEMRACSLVVEILSALDAAHRLGVIHRDIKPANILIDPAGHAKVADFGIAKIAEDADQTTTGMLLGTASYLAPERLAGRPATPASDLYAVGVLLFALLAGRTPFRGDTPLAVVQAIARGIQEPLGDLRAGLDPAVVAVVERAMHAEPEQRFESAPAMAAALIAATRRPDAAYEPTVRMERGPRADPDATQPVAPVGRAGARDTVAIEHETELLSRPAVGARARSRPRRAKHVTRVLAAVVVVTAIAVVLLASLLASNSGVPTPPKPLPPTSIPAPLSHALDGLDHAVKP